MSSRIGTSGGGGISLELHSCNPVCVSSSSSYSSSILHVASNLNRLYVFVQIGTVNKDHVALEGVALALSYFRKKDAVAIPKWLIGGILTIFLLLFVVAIMLSYK